MQPGEDEHSAPRRMEIRRVVASRRRNQQQIAIVVPQRGRAAIDNLADPSRFGSDYRKERRRSDKTRKNARNARHGIARINDSAARSTPDDVQIRCLELSKDRECGIDCAATALMPLGVLAFNDPQFQSRHLTMSPRSMNNLQLSVTSQKIDDRGWHQQLYRGCMHQAYLKHHPSSLFH